MSDCPKGGRHEGEERYVKYFGYLIFCKKCLACIADTGPVKWAGYGTDKPW